MPKSRPKRGLGQWLTQSDWPLFVIDDRRILLIFNRGCEQLTGWSAGELIGQRCDQVATGETEQLAYILGVLAPPEEAFQSSVLFRGMTLYSKGGLAHRCELQFYPLGDSAGDGRRRVLGVIRPISNEPVPESVQPTDWHVELSCQLVEVRQRFGAAVVARTAAMQRVAAQVQLARSGTAAVHVRGAAGTGKSHLVRQIFYGTEQKDKAFLPIDCQARPAELERLFNRLAELRPGEQLPGGLCLRRVDELPARFHQPLRQWLERVGSSVRIYSTATQSLDALVAADQFDAPLAAALTTLTIELPELSQRRSEIPLLAQQVLEQFNRGADQQFQGYSEEVLSLFSRYHWPGNLRELEQVVTTARNRSAGKTIEVEHLPVPFLASVRADDLPPAPEFPPLEEYLAHVERDLLQAALTAARGNKSLVAQWLRVPRPRLYRRLEALGLSEPTAMADPDRPATDPD